MSDNIFSKSVCLFRTDMAKDNDEYMSLASESNYDLQIAGVSIKIGKEWVPDFLQVDIINNDIKRIELTIIELESLRQDAVISSSKYLPEDQKSIIEEFRRYLEIVGKQCHSTADPREEKIHFLQNLIDSGCPVYIYTAACLRDKLKPVERLPLIDYHLVQYEPSEHALNTFRLVEDEFLTKKGKARVTRKNAELFQRCIYFVDAVIRDEDVTESTITRWLRRRNLPLKVLIKNSESFSREYPELNQFIQAKKAKGLKIEINPILMELSKLWSTKSSKNITADKIRDVFKDIITIMQDCKPHEKISKIFERIEEKL